MRLWVRAERPVVVSSLGRAQRYREVEEAKCGKRTKKEIRRKRIAERKNYVAGFKDGR